eukprot:3064939-Pyramimonas_sp.AAC.1
MASNIGGSGLDLKRLVVSSSRQVMFSDGFSGSSSSATSVGGSCAATGEYSDVNQARKEAGGNTMNGRNTTVNTDASGPLLQYLEQARDAAILVQEHKADHQMLPELQQQIQNIGYHGVYAAAERTEADGLSSG